MQYLEAVVLQGEEDEYGGDLAAEPGPVYGLADLGQVAAVARDHAAQLAQANS